MLPLLLRRAVLPLFETPGGPGGGPPHVPPADPPDGMFGRAYVEDLRKENAANRVKARDATAALSAVGEMLGLAPEHLGDPARVKAAAIGLRTTSAVDAAIARHGVDPRLTKGLLAGEGALAPLADLPPAEWASELDRILTALVRDTPALKVGPGTGARRSGLPNQGPGAPPAQRISPRELREGHYSPEEIARLQRQGLIDHAGPK